MDKKKVIGILIFVVLILAIVGIRFYQKGNKDNNEAVIDKSNLKEVLVATGGGKEDFIADEKVVEILENEYGLNVIYDSWSNGKLIVNPLKTASGYPYDLMFCSDQRFYDYYQLPPDESKGEAERYRVLTGGQTLNTPIVIYSWAEVVDAFVKEGIVTEKEGVYYITDMNKLLDYIFEGKSWSDIGLDLYGSIKIRSTDPVTSSPGATYYGLLLSIMAGGTVTDENIEENLPKLKDYYIKSGYMNNSPADLFQSYLKQGMGSNPLIVDYEKSIIEFANSNPDAYESIKDEIRILYPTPTIWNSHCIATFTEAGKEYYKAFENKEIQEIAWSKYGFRTGITGGSYDVSSLGLGIPQNITSAVTGLKMDYYNRLIEYLGE